MSTRENASRTHPGTEVICLWFCKTCRMQVCLRFWAWYVSASS